MPIYAVTGRLGSGKTLYAVDMIRDRIIAGCPVATNLDLRLEHLPAAKAPVYRIPDRPTAKDLQSLGVGSEDRDESRFGLLVLDEAATWLNSREWGDKGRQALIDWLVHARKFGWEVVFIIQSLAMLDKQIRDALVEYHVTCRRLDRLRIPFVGGLLNSLTFGLLSGNLPRLHVAQVKYGLGISGTVVKNDFYRGEDLYKAYDTRQAFSPFYDAGLYSMIRPRIARPKVRQLKPKLPHVKAAMQLPPAARVRILRSIERCDPLPARQSAFAC
jgi:hypothetical protein